jgi:hypothetical protein
MDGVRCGLNERQTAQRERKIAQLAQHDFARGRYDADQAPLEKAVHYRERVGSWSERELVSELLVTLDYAIYVAIVRWSRQQKTHNHEL